MLKNKIYFYNVTEGIIDTSVAEDFYEIIYLQGNIQEFALHYSQGIIYFDPYLKLKKTKFEYFREIILVDRSLLKEFMDPSYFLTFLDKNFGRKRIVNPKQFEIIKGTVVRSKVQPNLGVGYVVDIKEDNIRVKFPKAASVLTKTDFICHKSVLRVVSHIKEVEYEHEESA